MRRSVSSLLSGSLRPSGSIISDLIRFSVPFLISAPPNHQLWICFHFYIKRYHRRAPLNNRFTHTVQSCWLYMAENWQRRTTTKKTVSFFTILFFFGNFSRHLPRWLSCVNEWLCQGQPLDEFNLFFKKITKKKASAALPFYIFFQNVDVVNF